jgi:pimeloyl-ACP methyl ester carboxylesterase
MRIRLHDLTIGYEDNGSGQPLLFIHGYPLNRTMWEPQIAGLADVARVIIPDLRGYGESDPVPGPYSMEMLADDCSALLDAIGVTQPVVVCGLSMGGYVTFAFYRKYAARVAGLILAATRAGVDSAEGKAGRTKSAELAREQGSGPIVETMLPKMLSPQSYQARPELVARVRRILASASVEGIVGALLAMRERPDSTPTLAQIGRSALILHGADDQLISPQEAQAMRAAIKASQLRMVPGAGHLPNLEQPELFNDAVREFLFALTPSP